MNDHTQVALKNHRYEWVRLRWSLYVVFERTSVPVCLRISIEKITHITHSYHKKITHKVNARMCTLLWWILNSHFALEHTGTSCPAGRSHHAGDATSFVDTDACVSLCGTNEHVVNGQCVSCPSGTFFFLCSREVRFDWRRHTHTHTRTKQWYTVVQSIFGNRKRW